MSKEKKSKKMPNKMRIGGIAAIAAALVLLGGGIFLMVKENDRTVTPGNLSAVGQEDAATACQNLMSEYYAAIMGEDAKALYQMMAPPEYWTYYKDSYAKSESEIIATYTDAINNTLASWKASCGSNVKVSFQIEASAEQNKDFLTEWSQTMNATIGEDVLTAQDAMTLEVVQTVTGSSNTQKTTIHPTLIKVNDTWYILDEGTGSAAAQ